MTWLKGPATQRGVPLMALISIGLMMQSAATDTYVGALPSLSQYFGAGMTTVQLTLSFFLLGFAVGQLIVGPISDRFGRRPALLLGMILFLLGSLGCAIAPTIWVLIVARFFQAIGCCTGFIIARAVLRDVYEPAEGMRMMVKASFWLSLAPLFGPIVGGYLDAWFGWRAIFLMHAALAIGIFGSAFYSLPETNVYKNPHATRISDLAANMKFILKQRAFWAFGLPGGLSFGTIFVYIAGASTVWVNILGLPASRFGYAFCVGAFGYMCGTVLAQRLMRRYHEGVVFRIGTAISLGASLLFIGTALAGVFHWSILVLVMYLTICAHGMNSPLSQAGAVKPFPELAGTAASLSGCLYMASASIIGIVVGMTYNGTVYPLALIALTMSAVFFICVRVFPELKIRS